MGWGTERKLEGWSAFAPKYTSLADYLRPSKGLLTRERQKSQVASWGEYGAWGFNSPFDTREHVERVNKRPTVPPKVLSTSVCETDVKRSPSR